MQRFVRSRPNPWGLTARELEVLSLVVEGMSNDAIARRLALSSRTVQTHVASAIHKSGTHTRTGLAVQALRLGVIPLHPAGRRER